MFEMILNLPFGNAKHLGQLVRGQARAGQQFDHALAGRAGRNEHGGIVILRQWKAKLDAERNRALHRG